MQKYGDPKVIWSADPDIKNRYQGKTEVVFDDFPELDHNTHFYITWDKGWVKYEINGELREVIPAFESAYAFRFRTK